MSKALDIIRWIGFLPIAVIAAWLAWSIVNILHNFSFGWVGIKPDGFIISLYIITVNHVVMGATFVYIGAKIVPAHRIIITFVLGGISIIASGFLLFNAIMVEDWIAVWGSLCIVMGAGGLVWSVHANEVSQG